MLRYKYTSTKIIACSQKWFAICCLHVLFLRDSQHYFWNRIILYCIWVSKVYNPFCSHLVNSVFVVCEVQQVSLRHMLRFFQKFWVHRSFGSERVCNQQHPKIEDWMLLNIDNFWCMITNISSVTWGVTWTFVCAKCPNNFSICIRWKKSPPANPSAFFSKVADVLSVLLIHKLGKLTINFQNIDPKTARDAGRAF